MIHCLALRRRSEFLLELKIAFVPWEYHIGYMIGFVGLSVGWQCSLARLIQWECFMVALLRTRLEPKID